VGVGAAEVMMAEMVVAGRAVGPTCDLVDRPNCLAAFFFFV
jgi:hypothetical protein